MPNKSKPHKKGTRRIMRTGREISKPTHSVKDVLARVSPVLSSIANQRVRQNNWHQWLGERLGLPLSARITGVVERDGTLVIFTESAGWSVRVRYALADIEKELREAHPSLTEIHVRVMPRNTK